MKDEKLQGNEKIETAIEGLKKEPTQEMLAHALTVIRRRMKEDAELIVAVDPALEGSQLNVHVLRLEDGSSWWMAFTSFEEEIKGANKVMSTFMGNMRQMRHCSIPYAKHIRTGWSVSSVSSKTATAFYLLYHGDAIAPVLIRLSPGQ